MRKAMTLRLNEDEAEQLAALAKAEGVPISDVVRTAIAEHVDRRRRDPDFRERLKAAMERHKRILERLAES